MLGSVFELSSILCTLMHPEKLGFCPQEYGAALKVVKLDADANKDLVEKYKVRIDASWNKYSTS